MIRRFALLTPARAAFDFAQARKALALQLFAGTLVLAAPADITPSSYLQHIRYLASDDLGGRGNGSEGLERAADYIASVFKSAGLQPGGDGGSFFQSFDAEVTVEPPATTSLVIHVAAQPLEEQVPNRAARDERLMVGDQFYPLSIIDRRHGEREPSVDRVPLVFAGFGIHAPALGYDDFAGVDVNGKAVLVFTHEPQESDPSSRFAGASLTPGAAITVKAREAAERGAVMLLVTDDPAHHTDYAVARAWWNDPQSDEMAIPVVRVARSRLSRPLPGIDLDQTGQVIDRTLEPQSRLLPGVTLSYTERRARLRPRIRNVVGMIPGSDPTLAREAIVIGAHFDHLGMGGRFSDSPEATGTVHNGADDNASGTAAVIEACRAAAKLDPRPARTIVCVTFAGEEIGLLGSEYYTAHAAIPMERTRAMINLDMVGRARGRVMVEVFGAKPWMGDVRKELRAWTRLTVDDFSRGGYAAGSSDEDSFAKSGVPAVAFFTGFHSDYHRPTDDWQKIDADGGAHIAELALKLAERFAR
jgi:hypothetical protein